MLVTADASTPEGKGLVPTALAEARTAIQAAVRATEARGDLAQMQRYAAQVLHAIDPQLADGDGTGLGYGVRRATTAILAHAEAIAGADTRQDAVAVTPRAVAAARQVLQTAEKLTAVAQRVLAASSAADAEPLAQEMLTVAAQLVSGADQDGDGRVRAILGEGGLLLVQFSMNVLHATRNNPIREALR